MTSTVTSVVQSRWGFHNSGYDTYQKLKFLNFLYLGARRQAAAWERWNRKEPHNRVSRHKDGSTTPLPEPAINPIFSRKITRTTNWWKGKFVKEGRQYDTLETTDHGIPEAYHSTRPVAGAEQVTPLKISVAFINELYERALTESKG